ncbi:ankyrin-3 isoform X2 [Halyomorpha halys]|uniref:ankyrin-3 isoform X2 n=1 Tax=Halyomorpha halys TaxID=286706 RepID=UPI0006D4FD53|nr:serine/threonine-protein phosphatase 6 regulatory ankyrin repeat subunit C-like isoform X2 [Halyomorpha halys]
MTTGPIEEADQLLLHSTLLNDTIGCERAFQLGANPNACQDNKVTALHIAAEKGFPGITSALIKGAKKSGKKLNLNPETVFRNTPLVLSIMHDNIEVMEMLLAAGADPNKPHTFERTPLHIAAFFGRVKATIILIDYHANMNVVDCFDQTPLSLALIARHSAALVRHLLEGGADPNFRTKSSMPILSLAVLSCNKYKELKNVNFLIKAGADVKATDNIKLDTALHKAAQTGYIKCIDLLLRKGANIFAQNIYGHTPLNIAIRYKNVAAAIHLYQIEEELEEEEFNKLTPIEEKAPVIQK